MRFKCFWFPWSLSFFSFLISKEVKLNNNIENWFYDFEIDNTFFMLLLLLLPFALDCDHWTVVYNCSIWKSNWKRIFIEYFQRDTYRIVHIFVKIIVYHWQIRSSITDHRLSSTTCFMWINICENSSFSRMSFQWSFIKIIIVVLSIDKHNKTVDIIWFVDWSQCIHFRCYFRCSGGSSCELRRISWNRSTLALCIEFLHYIGGCLFPSICLVAWKSEILVYRSRQTRWSTKRWEMFLLCIVNKNYRWTSRIKIWFALKNSNFQGSVIYL